MVFYQMLTGQLPAHPIQPPSSKVQIDVRLDEVVLRALEKNPETRYQQASALKTQVETIAATPSNQTAPQTRLQPSITKMNGNTHISIWSWTGVVVVAACLFALGLAMFHKNVKPSQSQAVDSQSLGGFKQSKAELAEEQAFIRMANGDLEAYIADRTKLIELKPGDAASYHLRGYAKQIKGDFDGAIADYTKAINLGMPISYYTRAYSKQLKNDLDGAIADYTQVIELNPNDAQAYFHRGLAKQAQGNLAGAAADHSKAIELKPDLESQ